jgi:hypothetical protein
LDNVTESLLHKRHSLEEHKLAANTPTPHNATVNPPNWEHEKKIPVRALWEIAAMAGEVDPRLENVKQKKKEAPEWRAAYNQMLRRMVDALRPTSARDNYRINFDPTMPFNVSIQSDRKLHRQMRVDVVSACKFLETTYGVDVLPEGLRELHKVLLHSDVLSGVPADAQPGQVLKLSKSAASRDQNLANEKKTNNLLSIALAAMAIDLWGHAAGNDEPISPDDIQSLLVSHKLTRIHGLRSDVVAKAIENGKKLIKNK